MKKFLIKATFLGIAAITMLTGCSKMFDKLPEHELDNSNAYANVYDADAAVMGVYGKFMGLAEQYIVLNELRADLLDYTQNASKWLRQISNHTVAADNPYADPRPFYEVIINCNDVLFNLNKMYADKKISESDYTQRYSDIACLRSFLYLQLGIHYGDEVRYVTDPLATLTDAQNPALFSKLSFDILLDSLIAFTEPIPFKEQYATGTSLNITLDGYPTSKFFINKKVLLGDLYLWKGNYNKAASYYREVMETTTPRGLAAGNVYTSQYKMGWWGDADNNIVDNRVTFITRARSGDMNSLLYDRGWRTMFEAGYTSDKFNYEMVWSLPFDNKFAPVNPFINLFSPLGGDYLLKPSKQIMDMWASQQMAIDERSAVRVGSPYDARGLFSVSNIGGQPVAMKFISKYINWDRKMPTDMFVKNGDWYLFRQTQLNMRFAEAANMEGRHRLAYAFISNGIGGNFDSSGASNKTRWQNTLSYPYPYNFDARNGEIPSFRGPWYRHTGVRSRAFLTSLPITATTAADSLLQVEDGLLQETALENAFEGTRWADLLRIARRRNDPAVIADKVYQKLLKDGDPNAGAARAKLMNREGWYLPFKLD